ncbi:MAG: hypothetical protein K5637_02020 [Lachnospiraceae bacterium]|nr:hypothetical protein [Lachnospiraceae bacterium]
MSATAETGIFSFEMSGDVETMSLSLTGNVETMSLSLTEGMVIISEADYYTGETEVTPSSETQTLETSGKVMPDNVIINPIPSNYGLITWNGSTLTVS